MTYNFRPDRQFEDKPAKRERVPLLIGLVGPSSSGKTKSALRIADGIRSVVGGEVYGIDTEARRMLHYAGVHQFRHVPFDAPFGSLDYLAAMQHCVAKGASTVIIDSMSHEHEGPGGLIDFQEKEIERLAGDDYAKRERVKMLAWQKPKAARRALINGMLQLNANMIFCFRAREKTKPVKQPDGKIKPIEMGFVPIAGEEFLFEMTANCLLLPKSDGVPTLTSEHQGELATMKMPEYLAHCFPAGNPLSEDTGRCLAEWARGAGAEGSAAAATQAQPSASAPALTGDALFEEGRDKASDGPRVFNPWYRGLTGAQVRELDEIKSELTQRMEAARERQAQRETA